LVISKKPWGALAVVVADGHIILSLLGEENFRAVAEKEGAKFEDSKFSEFTTGADIFDLTGETLSY
jgi:hypothetical protein